ncbi:MAG: glutamyl-tRNA reductase [Pseudomonadota bacterium]
MSLKILGLNHNTAPLEIRERIVFAGPEIPAALSEVRTLSGVNEAVLLSTCNRTEFYLMSDGPGQQALKEWLIGARKLDAGFHDSLFMLEDADAIRHIFRVACGLDSMVLGEPQILGQLKEAWRSAQESGALGADLGRLMQHTFSVAKKVRTDTEIGSSPVSVAYAAVHLAQQFFADFGKQTAILVGAGVTIDLVAKHLKRKNIGRLFVANRNLDRARNLAGEYGGYALPLSELEGTLPEADILISSTASPEPVIGYAEMQKAVKARKYKPMFACDIAVPRDIHPDVSKLDDVYLYTIDDLDKVVLEGQGSREAAVDDANRILDDEINRYLSVQRARQTVPTINALRDHADSVRDEVLAQALRRIGNGADGQEVLEYATAAMLKKLLHHPSVTLREAGESGDEELVAAARKLFGLRS